MKPTAVELLNEQLLFVFKEKQDKLIDAETFFKVKKELLIQAKTEEKIQMINFLKSVFQQDGFDYEQAYNNFFKKSMNFQRTKKMIANIKSLGKLQTTYDKELLIELEELLLIKSD